MIGLYREARTGRREGEVQQVSAHSAVTKILSRAAALLALALLGLALGAIQLAPLFEVVRNNFRSGSATFDQIMNWAYPWRRVVAFFIPNFYGNPSHHAYFDLFMQKFLQKIYDRQKNEGKIFSPKNLIYELGLEINDENSIYYWAAKNNIPVFCPGIVDGSLGDMMVFFKQSHPDFILDVSKEVMDICRLALNCEKTGGILLGGGISKHFVLNANIFKEGFDYCVYINTGEEYDGSDSGARIEEAISWGKVKAEAPAVKIHADATIVFPLLVAGALVEATSEHQ